MSTRERILDAAAGLLRTRGIAQATTREIALASGVSEPTLYKYFGDKERLLLAVLEERLPGPSRVTLRPGEGDLAETLTDLAHAYLDFYRESFPMFGALLADPQRMAAHRDALARHGGTPARPVAALAAYLRAEQAHGRVAARTDPEAAAALLVGACFQQAFLRYYTEGPDAAPAPRSFAASLATALLGPL
ncbi:TetR/AcrR family transcriptional regulator [Actinocorallia sp. API 0066]|uniref:TetR/AcrR family transcriptional regulator n=1 Tax=Actinocorallia sp. API 0066 TaxID=2896846 RepID=UPI001E300F07|nr:TetR/AcrR family transcriptional regulator [Actinocorallia sp. API 0066]MCD0452374.1 TetR/AcrR family transcriptional regulator [Actinocorallia sp. API 0066]